MANGELNKEDPDIPWSVKLQEKFGLVNIVEEESSEDDAKQTDVALPSMQNTPHLEQEQEDERLTQVIREKLLAHNDVASRFLTVYFELSEFEPNKRVQKSLKLAGAQGSDIVKIFKSTMISLPTFMGEQRMADVKKLEDDVMRLRQESKTMTDEMIALEEQVQEIQKKLQALQQSRDASELLISEKTQKVKETAEVYSRVNLRLQSEMQTIVSQLEGV